MPDSAREALIRRLARNGSAWDPTLVSGRVRFIPDSAKWEARQSVRRFADLGVTLLAGTDLGVITLGSIAPGHQADLVLLDANPLEDIRATRAIRGVLASGRWHDRAALDRTLRWNRLSPSYPFSPVSSCHSDSTGWYRYSDSARPAR